MIRTILAPLDGSPLAERALEFVPPIAWGTGARAVVLRAASAAWGEHPPESELKEPVERLREAGVRAEARVYTVFHDDTALALVEAADAYGADLIVLSTHGRGGLGRWLYGSVADALIRRTERPLLLIPTACDSGWPTDRPLRLVATLDGSVFSEAVIRPSADLAAALRAELILLRVVPRLAGSPQAVDIELERSRAREYLESVGRGLEVTPTVLYDGPRTPAAAIAEFAREQTVDVVAMATHGYGGLARMVMGSTTTGVLHRVRAPLLVVRPRLARVPLGHVATAAAPT